MSGIEVAGLVLGAFPVLIWTCEKYKDVFGGLEGWLAFRARFEDFTLSLETERQCYRGVLKNLLCLGPDPFLNSITEAEAVLENAQHEVWKSEELVDKLRYRLEDKYELLMATLNRMNKTIQELYKLVGIKDAQWPLNLDDRTKSWWEEKLERTKFSFSTKRVQKLEQLKIHNENLERILRDTDRLDGLKVAKPAATIMKALELIRSNACNLHALLKSSWHCSCSGAHRARLRLEPRERTQKPRFVVLFEESKALNKKSVRQSEIAFEMQDVLKDELRGVVPSQEQGLLKPNSTQGPTTGVYTREKGQVSQTSVISFDSSATLIESTTKHDTNLDTKDKISSEYHTKDRMQSKLISGLFRHKKEKKKARFVLDTEPPIGKRQDQTSPQSSPVSIPETNEGTQIHDLCDTASSVALQKQQRLYMIDCHKRCYNLSCINDPACLDSRARVDLRSLLMDRKSRKFTPRQRIITANALASSLLQLQTTPWAPFSWQKTDIWFLCEGAVVLDQPYLAHDFFSMKSKTVSESTESRASDPTRFVQSSDSDFDASLQADPFDTPLIRFGILLLELCFGETIESRSQDNAESSEQGPDKGLKTYATALKWSLEVTDVFPDLAGPINRCLRESFGEKIDWKNSSFLQNIHLNLVKPIQDAVKKNGWL